MFNRETLVWISCRKRNSKPFSRVSMQPSRSLSFIFASWTFLDKQVLEYKKEMAWSTFSNSVLRYFSSWSSQDATDPLCIILVTSDHLLALGFWFLPINQDKNSWKTIMVIDLTSLIFLYITSVFCWSSDVLWEPSSLHSIDFIAPMLFLISFFIFFFKQRYVFTLLLRSDNSLPLMVRREDWRSLTCSFMCSNISLVVPHMSTNPIDASCISCTHLFLLLKRNCWSWGNCSNSWTQLYTLARPQRPVIHLSDVTLEHDASKCLSCSISSCSLDERGWEVVGKLIDLTWKWLSGLEEETSITVNDLIAQERWKRWGWLGCWNHLVLVAYITWD